MIDMHREAFDLLWITTMRDPKAVMYNNPLDLPADGDAEGWAKWGWMNALRYRDEHHCDCAHTCKFCRDEQEKGDGRPHR